MKHEVTIVEDVNSSKYYPWEWPSVCPDWTVSRHLFWESAVPALSQPFTESLLVANAVPATGGALEFFRRLREKFIPTLAIVREEDRELLQTVVEAVDDFVVWPARVEEVCNRARRLLGDAAPTPETIKASLAGELALRQLVGQDPGFLKVIRQATLFSANNAPVLLSGETGTGKEQCARFIHLMSQRHKGPFIPVDCGALPDHLFENELFGHEAGAFTDARSGQRGLIALAAGGTLFLDEIDNLLPSTQAKLLRVLQEHMYRPLGSEQFKSANIRVIAASNRNLEHLVEQKQFRADLFFRVNVLRIHLPALRERRGDIGLLGRHFVNEVCKSAGLARKLLSRSAVHKLEAQDWPGNVRELYNTIQRAVLSSPGPQITATEVAVNAENATNADPSLTFRSAKQQAIRRFEQHYVREMLEKHEGNITQAARDAGKDRRAFGRLAKKYGFSEHSH